MVNPSIGPTSYTPPSSPVSSTPSVPEMSQQMQQQLSKLSEKLQKVRDDATLSTEPTFQNQFADNVNQLKNVVEKAIQLR